MKIMLIAVMFLFAAATTACDKNSISSPCFADNISGGFGSSCGSDR